MEIQTLRDLAIKWPSTVVARDEIDRFSGGLVTPRYVANLDSRGLGPAGRFMVGGKVAYSVNSVIDWLMARAKPVKTRRMDAEAICG
jgi:hypothetical protein